MTSNPDCRDRSGFFSGRSTRPSSRAVSALRSVPPCSFHSRLASLSRISASCPSRAFWSRFARTTSGTTLPIGAADSPQVLPEADVAGHRRQFARRHRTRRRRVGGYRRPRSASCIGPVKEGLGHGNARRLSATRFRTATISCSTWMPTSATIPGTCAQWSMHAESRRGDWFALHPRRRHRRMGLLPALYEPGHQLVRATPVGALHRAIIAARIAAIGWRNWRRSISIVCGRAATRSRKRSFTAAATSGAALRRRRSDSTIVAMATRRSTGASRRRPCGSFSAWGSRISPAEGSGPREKPVIRSTRGSARRESNPHSQLGKLP